MLQSLVTSIFRCSHRRTTFPITRSRKLVGAHATAGPNGTYVVCLDCGREFAYDWKTMSVGQQVEVASANRAAEPLLYR
jgi:hypothetical protein